MRRLPVPLPLSLSSTALTSLAAVACAAALALVGIAGALPDAAAQDVPTDLAAYARLPVCTLDKDGTRLATEPCRTAPTKADLPRRAAAEMITPMPHVALARPAVAPRIPAPDTSLINHGPQPLVACDAGGCRDASGVRHNTGSGNATVTPGGKLCNINGIWLQCS